MTRNPRALSSPVNVIKQTPMNRARIWQTRGSRGMTGLLPVIIAKYIVGFEGELWKYCGDCHAFIIQTREPRHVLQRTGQI